MGEHENGSEDENESESESERTSLRSLHGHDRPNEAIHASSGSSKNWSIVIAWLLESPSGYKL